MILTRNVVVDGQTIFSGERIAGPSPEEWIHTQRMNWLHEHQIALRIALETGEETPIFNPRHNPLIPSVILDKSGDNIPCVHIDKISPQPQ